MAANSFAIDAIGVSLSLGVLASAIGAAAARSLFSVSMFVAVAGALAAAALVAVGAGEAALTQALFGVGVAPVVLLASLLLSTRAAKPRRDGRPWLTIIAAVAATAAVLWVLPELGPAPTAAPTRPGGAFDLGVTAWLAVLGFTAVAGAVALLGYGERGALQRARLERDE